ncbi:MAG TPA: hypothetical protein PKN04_15705 [bacterium]|nr:hypothetical protein [bacterium]
MINWTTWSYLALAKWISLLTFAAVAIWAALRPKSFVYHESPNQKRWRDLRIWSVLLLAVQIAIYLAL